MNVLVAYESRSGHTRQAAEAIAQAARELGCNVEVKSVWKLQSQDVLTADMIFVGTWVQGLILMGVSPSGARRWVPALPSLVGKSVSIFCTYAINPRNALTRLSSLLMDRGATVVAEHAFHHNQPTEGAERFVRSVLQPARV